MFDSLELSDETLYTNYITDTYRLAKPIIINGHLYRLTYLSDELVKKYKLRQNTILKTPNISYYGIPSIELPLLTYLNVKPEFYTIKSITDRVEVVIRNLYDYDNRFDFSKVSKLYGSDKEFKTFEELTTAYLNEIKNFKKLPYHQKVFHFKSIAETDNGEIKEIYYLLPINT